METVFDACAFINLANSTLLEQILRLPHRKWLVGELVRGECHYPTHERPELDTAIFEGKITLLNGSDMDASTFLTLLDAHNLGDGETECLAYSTIFGYVVCSDDGRARNIVSSTLGGDKIIGSIGLLREGIAARLITSDDAVRAYKLMKRRGAFLPDLRVGIFE